MSGTLKLKGGLEIYEASNETKSYHLQLQIAFSKKKQYGISAKLGELFRQRVTADYFPDAKVEPSNAKNGVDLGRNLLELIESDP